MIKDEVSRRELMLEYCRRDFWAFCKTMTPRFYKPRRQYLRDMCDKIQHFIEKSDKHFLVINTAPRHGKSLTAQHLTGWLFGLNPETKIMTGSYNEKLSTTFARNVRNMISTQKADENIVYSDIFPGTRVKYGEASAQMWALDGQNQTSYLATSQGGTATGFGCSMLICDDMIKNAEEAYNEVALDDTWEWFANTMLQRLEGKSWKVIVIMTRWAEGDLAGRIIKAFGDDVELITYKAVQDDGSMLCDEILSRADYETKTKEMNLDIVEANYNQKPIDIGGRLYSNFKTWEDKPTGVVMKNYTDTADTGTDFLCSINYFVKDNEAYITDLVFTDEPMEVTEEKVADLLFVGDVNEAVIESNNGGRGFARNVERILRQKYNSNRTFLATHQQTHNKESRILTSSAWVQNHVYMPLNWHTKYPEFYKQVMSYQRKGKNAHDDSVDVLAAIYEDVTARGEPQIITDLDLGLGGRRRVFER